MAAAHPLVLTRQQILAHRRVANGLVQRLPPGLAAVRRAAWAGLQDSMPRAAVLSLHARVEGTMADAWARPPLVQLWGPRFSTYAVTAEDHAIFSLGRLPTGAAQRRRAEELAGRLQALLDGGEMPYAEAGRALGVPPHALRHAAATGVVLIVWDGARRPNVRTVQAPTLDPAAARLELARRHLHIFGPSTAEAFAQWAGIPIATGRSAYQALAPLLVRVRTPVGEAAILAEDEAGLRAPASPVKGARLLPSGDAYFLLQGLERALLVPEADRRALLWTPRVWPGALLLDGELAGTWRRAGRAFSIAPWRRLSQVEREAVEAEAASLPVPDDAASTRVQWLAVP